MRFLFSVVFLIGGLGLFLLETLSHAFVSAPTLSFYEKQLQSFPVQQRYSRAELADAAWQVWTNRVNIPPQSTYSVADLKTALVSPLLGTQQHSCDRSMFEHAIARVAGVSGSSDHAMAVVGLVAMLVGAFLLGGVLFPAHRRGHENAA